MDPEHRYSPRGSEAGFWRGVDYSARFFMGDADVQRALRQIAALELVRAASLPRELGGELDASVRAKYDELWVAAQTRDEQ